MDRKTDLLLKAADALDDGRDPLDGAFLREHNVRADECFDLAENLATGARLLVRTTEELAAGGLRATVAAHQLVDIGVATLTRARESGR